MPTNTPALKLLHEKIHAAPFGSWGLNQIPFSLFADVAEFAEHYAAEENAKLRADCKALNQILRDHGYGQGEIDSVVEDMKKGGE